MEIRPSKVEDILEMMERNKAHYPDFHCLSDERKRDLAQLNLDTGLAQSYFIDGKLVAAAGIRMIGVGEAWLAVDPEAKTEHKKTLMRETKNLLQQAKEEGVWCLFAENKISENYLEHLGFKRKVMYVRVK
jgi:N-acetylglutamate synthase-like GNAT family acetyltransferase